MSTLFNVYIPRLIHDKLWAMMPFASIWYSGTPGPICDQLIPLRHALGRVSLELTMSKSPNLEAQIAKRLTITRHNRPRNLCG
jgi:hypothetical protein